jgi:hypothetical protein
LNSPKREREKQRMNDTRTPQKADASTSATRDLIKTLRQTARRKFTAEEKIRVVMEGIRGDEPVTVLCRGEGIHATIYYGWLKDFMEAGRQADGCGGGPGC